MYAGLRGAQVLTGHCYEGESSLPYRPFVEAFRQYTRTRPDAELRTQLGPGAPEIATLVSEIRQRFPDIEEAPKLDPEAERLRLFESVTEFLRNASTAQPLVLHLDDLHWADKPSLLLLQHLAQRTARDRLLILGAYRDVELERTHPLAEALGALRRLPNYRRVLLRGLPQESVFDLLSVIDPSEEGAAGAAGAGRGAPPGDRRQPVLHPRGARAPHRDRQARARERPLGRRASRASPSSASRRACAR